MKKLLIFILVLISINSIAQNQFTKKFIKADSVFTEKIDSLKFNKVIRELEDTTKVILTVEQCLLLYFDGYISGSLNYKQKNKLDFDKFLYEVKLNKKSLLVYTKLNK